MENKVIIKVSDLSLIIKLVLTKLDTINKDSCLILDKDYYWNISNNEIYNVYENPNDLTIGSLVEDWTFLQEIITEKREILNYDLYKLSMLLKYISEQELLDNTNLE